MDYVIELTISAATSASSPETDSFTAPRGVVKQVSLYFPFGCAGLVRVTINHNERQMWPSNIENSYNGNDLLIQFPEDYRILEPWNRFTVLGWSPGTLYDHTPVVRVTVIEDQAPAWARIIFGRLLRKGM